MSRLTPLAVVEKYHAKYLEYETAFNKESSNKADMEAELVSLLDSELDEDSDEFMNKMIDIMIDKPQKKSDVNNSAYKFYLYADFYLLTQEDPLPENIQKDYDSLPIKDSIKTYFSVEGEKFVKNEKEDITDEMRAYFKAVVNQVKQQTQK
jgi:hypothetical protein